MGDGQAGLGHPPWRGGGLGQAEACLRGVEGLKPQDASANIGGLRVRMFKKRRRTFVCGGGQFIHLRPPCNELRKLCLLGLQPRRPSKFRSKVCQGAFVCCRFLFQSCMACFPQCSGPKISGSIKCANNPLCLWSQAAQACGMLTTLPGFIICRPHHA